MSSSWTTYAIVLRGDSTVPAPGSLMAIDEVRTLFALGRVETRRIVDHGAHVLQSRPVGASISAPIPASAGDVATSHPLRSVSSSPAPGVPQ